MHCASCQQWSCFRLVCPVGSWENEAKAELNGCLVRLNVNHPVPGGGHHSNPSVGGKNGLCFHNARLVGRERMSAEIALQKTLDLHLSHWTPF